MRLRMRWNFRLLHRVLAEVHLTCILFIGNRKQSHALEGRKGRSLGFYSIYIWMDWARCHCLFDILLPAGLRA